MTNLTDGKLELLTDMNSVLVLIDYKPTMIKSVSSSDKNIIMNAAIYAAKAADIWEFLLFYHLLIPKAMETYFLKSQVSVMIMRYLQE